MSLRTAVTILLSALVCLVLMGRPTIHTPSDPPDASKSAAPPLVAPQAIAPQPVAPELVAPRVDAPRPALLLPLYESFAAMQALDVHSTMKVLGTGAGREANPIAGAVIDSPAKLIVLKAGVTAGIMLATDRLRRRNPKTAVALMIALNGAYAAIAAHNYGVSGGIGNR